MNNVTTIQLDKNLVRTLKKLKKYPRQTYNEFITSLVNNARAQNTENQYDDFLHKIQQAKMKELWDNKEDEAWENA